VHLFELDLSRERKKSINIKQLARVNEKSGKTLIEGREEARKSDKYFITN
jgi:hypothetical protein